MRNLLSPKWIFLINTLPIFCLFILFWGKYEIVESLLEEDYKEMWTYFSVSLISLALLNFGFAIYLMANKRSIPVFYGILSLVFHITYIYLYSFNLNHIIPFNIPRWMLNESIFIYVGTFLMPTLAYSLLILVAHFTVNSYAKKAWVSLLIAMSVPITGYIFVLVIAPFWQIVDHEFEMHVFAVFMILGTLLFLFFLIQAIYILLNRNVDTWKKYELVWKIPITIIFPLLGLMLNNGLFFNGFNVNEDDGIFGSFNSPWFYILAILNGVFICLPKLENQIYRVVLFIGKSIFFAYTVYFFLVFLPFLPISVIAILAAGGGFLMLTPLILFIVHIKELNEDWKFLKPLYPSKLVVAVGIFSFLFIPFYITIENLQHRKTLNDALEYIYSPDYSKEYDINNYYLFQTIEVLESHKSSRNRGLFGDKLPYLTSYFNWVVLDNLTISKEKLNKINEVFRGEKPYNTSNRMGRGDRVKITNIASKSTFDESQQVWKSWIDLELTNQTGRGFAEYITTLYLPTGTSISDYYLYVGDRKEMGILAEKKSALWVYNNIRNENRDPGLLYYLTGNKVAFKVFPFAKDEVRRTGIEFIHKEPISITIDDETLFLGDEREINYSYEDEQIIYVPKAIKSDLKEVYREPYLQLLVDATDKKKIDNYIHEIEKITKQHPNLLKNAKISFVNSYVNTHPFDENWKQQYKEQSFEGGFYLERAIRKSLVEPYNHQTNTYPIIVVIKDKLDEAILDRNFVDLSFAYPESDVFYHLNRNSTLDAHQLDKKPSRISKTNTSISSKASSLAIQSKENKTYYLPNNNEASIILKTDWVETKDIQAKSWKTALELQAQWRSHILNPHKANDDWTNMIKSSFQSRIMTPLTSFLVVENETQKAILKQKQEQVLSSNKNYDLDDDSVQMSEPSWWVLVVLLSGFGFWRRKV